MAMLRKAVFATAMISTGLLSGTGMALAGGTQSADTHGSGSHGHDDLTSSHDSGATYQHGLVNSGDIKPNTNPDLCNNQVPVNVLGVQVPVDDAAATLGLLSGPKSGNSSTQSSRSCSNAAAS